MGAVRRNRRAQQAFLEHFAVSGRVDQSSEVAGIHKDTHYEWLKRDLNYAKAFERARDHAVDMLEAEAWRRARDGVEEPVFHAGRRATEIVDGPNGQKIERPAFVRKYSDAVLMFLLKGRRRDVYGDKIEATGKDGVPLFDLSSVRAYMKSVPDEEE